MAMQMKQNELKLVDIVERFNSTTIALAVKGSKIDIYLQTNQPKNKPDPQYFQDLLFVKQAQLMNILSAAYSIKRGGRKITNDDVKAGTDMMNNLRSGNSDLRKISEDYGIEINFKPISDYTPVPLYLRSTGTSG